MFDWNRRRHEDQVAEDSGGFLVLRPADGAKNTYILRDGAPLKIKAAGGIRDLDTAFKFIASGADRLGMSASVKVMEEWKAL